MCYIGGIYEDLLVYRPRTFCDGVLRILLTFEVSAVASLRCCWLAGIC